jgi:hypothetical protein
MGETGQGSPAQADAAHTSPSPGGEWSAALRCDEQRATSETRFLEAHTAPQTKQTTRRHGPRRRGAAIDEGIFEGCEQRREERTAEPESNPRFEDP